MEKTKNNPNNLEKKYIEDISGDIFTILENAVYKFREPIVNLMKKSKKYKIYITNKTLRGDGRIEIRNKKTGKKFKRQFVPLGMYTYSDNIWDWISSPDEIFRIHNERYDFLELFGESAGCIINNIFHQQVKISEENHTFIPFFMQLFNAKLNLVKFITYVDDDESKGIYSILYILADLRIEQKLCGSEIFKQIDVCKRKIIEALNLK